MTLDIGQLIEDAKMLRGALMSCEGCPRDFGLEEDFSREYEALERIIAYFEARYVPPSEPGSYKETRGVLAWKEGDEPAEDSIRRIRGG